MYVCVVGGLEKVERRGQLTGDLGSNDLRNVLLQSLEEPPLWDFPWRQRFLEPRNFPS